MRPSIRILTMIIGMACVSAVALVADHRVLAKPDGNDADKAAEIQPKLVQITALVDGSGRFIFTGRKARYQHNHWDPPANVVLDDKAWSELDQTPENWSDTAAQLELTGARIVKRTGRDVVALEITRDGFDLYFGDTPDGPAQYDVTIAIPRRK